MSVNSISDSYSSFVGLRHLASGSLEQVVLAVKHLPEQTEAILIFHNSSGRVMDIDTRGSDAEVLARLQSSGLKSGQAESNEPAAHNVSRGRGRPRLGVIPREVTLLPRHWAWLADQPGGASVALRKLVEAARKESAGQDQARAASQRAYHFMSTIAGDLPGFEEAARALFAGDRDKFESHMANWPLDIRQQACWLAFGRLRVRA